MGIPASASPKLLELQAASDASKASRAAAAEVKESAAAAAGATALAAAKEANDARCAANKKANTEAEEGAQATMDGTEGWEKVAAFCDFADRKSSDDRRSILRFKSLLIKLKTNPIKA